MRKQRTIEVDIDDIRCATPRMAWSCPIARACRDAGMSNAVVQQWPNGGWYVSWLESRHTEKRAKLPPSARKFAEAFDAEEPVLPFKFRIRYEA